MILTTLSTWFLFYSTIGDIGKMGVIIQFEVRRKIRRKIRGFVPGRAVAIQKCVNVKLGHSDTN